MKWGTGALNIGACRIETNPEVDDPRLGGKGTWSSEKMAKNIYEGGYAGERVGSDPAGRWPAHLIHDGSDDVLACFPQNTSQTGNRRNKNRVQQEVQSTPFTRGQEAPEYTDGGSPARFFYTAKPSPAERNRGLETAPGQKRDEGRKDGNPGGDNPRNRGVNAAKNHHPTVKPLALMRYLVRLITPPGGVVLDCFCGSGSTLIASAQEGFDAVGMDQEADYIEISRKRIAGELGMLVQIESPGQGAGGEG